MSELSLLTISKRHMATDFHLELVVEASTRRKGDSVLLEAHDLIAMIEGEISEFRETSSVYSLNHAQVGEWVFLNTHSLRILELSLDFHRQTSGYFDPFSKSCEPIRAESIEIDSSKTKFRRLDSNLQLGFGAIGKGYALDQVRGLLEREGFSNYRLSSGGSSWIIAGASATGDPWTIAWAWRLDADGDLAGRTLQLKPSESIAIGVSGTLEQGNHFYFGGKRADSKIASAFYGGRSAAEADALSTALFVGASREGAEILTKLVNPIRDPILAYVDLDEQIIYNQTFDKRFINTGK
jgi:thiamine biosynthesis lipoprotein